MNQSATNPPSRDEDLSDEDFLSPEESELLLGSLETQDRQTIGSGWETDAPLLGIEDEPDADEASELRIDFPPDQGYGRAQAHEAAKDSQGAMARIGAELKTLRAELMALKAHRFGHMEEGPEFSKPRIDYSSLVPQDPSLPKEELPEDLIEDLKTLLSYLDRLLEALPEDKIDEFGRSTYFELYKKVFKTLKIS